MDKIIEERDSILRSLQNLSPVNDEYSTVLKNLKMIQDIIDSAKEVDHKIALEDAEYERKEEASDLEKELKQKSFEADQTLKRKQFILRVCEVASEVALGSVSNALATWRFKKGQENYSKLFYDGLRFEETGVFGSSTVKNLTSNNKLPKAD